jgi:hypothetical protein
MLHPYVKVATSLQNCHCTSNIKPHSSMIAMTGTPRACPMAAFSGFYESPGPPPLGDVRGIVPPHCNDHQNGHQSGYIIHRCFICCRPGGRRGNTKPVVAQWRRPVASRVALDMLHWAIPHVSLQRLTMAINMVCRGGAFVRRRRLFRLA